MSFLVLSVILGHVAKLGNDELLQPHRHLQCRLVHCDLARRELAQVQLLGRVGHDVAQNVDEPVCVRRHRERLANRLEFFLLEQ